MTVGWLAVLGLLAAMASPVDPPPQGPGAAAAKPATEGSPADEVQRRLKALETSTLPEPQKTEAIKRYKQALEWHAAADQFKAKTDIAEAEVRAAPQRVAIAKSSASASTEATPTIPGDATLAQLERLLATAEGQHREAAGLASRLEAETKRRVELLASLPKLTAEATQKLEALRKQLAAPAIPDEPIELAQGRRAEMEAQQRTLEAELAWYQTATRHAAALAECFPLELDLAQRTVSRHEKVVAFWQRAVAERRKSESEKQAKQARRDVARAHPALRQLAQRNAVLAERRLKIAGDIERTATERGRSEAELKKLRDEFTDTREKLQIAGLTHTVGLILRHAQARLPNTEEHAQRLRDIEVEAPRLQLELMDLRNQRDGVRDLDGAVEQVVAELDISARSLDAEELAAMVRELLTTQRDYLDALSADHETYLKHLGAVELARRQLIDEVNRYGDFLAENVLWIRSLEPLWGTDLRQSAEGLAPLVDWRTWSSVAQTFGAELVDHYVDTTVFVIVVVALAAWRRRIRVRLRNLGDVASSASRQRFRTTVEVLVLTVLLASLWPAVTGYVAWRLAAAEAASDLTRAVAAGLLNTAWVFWTAELLRQTCRPRGLGELHLGWPGPALVILRRRLTRVMTLGLPLLMLTTTLERYHDRSGLDASGRLVFIAGMLVLTLFMHGVLSPSRGVLCLAAGRGRESGFQRLRHVWHVLAVGAPLSLAVLAAAGFYYTAQQLAARVQGTCWLVLGLLVVHALVWRYVAIVARQIRVRQVFQQHQNVVAPGTSSVMGRGATEQLRHAPLDAALVNAQMRQLLAGVLWVGLFAGVWLVWRDVLPAFRVLDRVQLWTSVIEQVQTTAGPGGESVMRKLDKVVPTTLGHLMIALIVAGGAMLAWKNMPGLLAVTLLDRLPLDPGGRHAVVAVVRYIVLLVGFASAFRLLGIGWSSIQWLAAAITVGLGFGLQEIFANFVSGLIILLERPIRVGDIVTVNGGTGTVTQIRMRATTIADGDRREMIVPNKKFITDDVVNWTLTDATTRMVLKVGVAYGSDAQLVARLLLKAANKHPLVLEEPAPAAVFTAFGPNSLDFELRVFIAERSSASIVQNDLNMLIERSFRDAKVEFGSATHEINLRTLPPGLEQALQAAPRRQGAA